MDRGARYDEDFFAWTQEQAAALRRAGASRVNADVDWENVAEEVEDMGKAEKRQIQSRLGVLAVHLLKWIYCPDLLDRCARPWRLTILEQRDELAAVLKDSPSLLRTARDAWPAIVEKSRRKAAVEAEVPLARFPQVPPITLDNALDENFPPDLIPVHLRDPAS
jgi:hypothetical protein